MITSASLTVEMLKPLREAHGHSIFIETGTFHGGGVQTAMLSGFKEAHSIEKARPLWHGTAMGFGGIDGVYLYLADSREFLSFLLDRFSSEKCLIFLDGHAIPGVQETAPGPCPLMDELKSIRKHSKSTILVDDCDILGTPVLDNIGIDAVIAELKKINSAYQITIVDGARKDSLLIAQLPYGN